MSKHLCILLCFHNTQHIKQCYESLKHPNIDFFIVENESENSEQIEDYFREQDVLGHIRFESNITFKAIEIFLKDYHKLLMEYEYITVSDCDLQVISSQDVLSEITDILNLDQVGVCCVDLSLENFPHHVQGSSGWIPAPIAETDQYIECATGVHLCTLKKENLHIFQQTFIDKYLRELAISNSLKWVKTKKNKATHLTWDLYHPGNLYFEFKKTTPNLWNHQLTSNYKKLK